MPLSGKKTRIVATLGPASSSDNAIRALLHAGVNVFRLNFSHGDHDGHARNIQRIHKQGRLLGMNPAILADLQGPKIRTGKTKNDETVLIQTGSGVALTTRAALCTSTVISVDYPRLIDEIGVGQHIMINDGAIRLRAEKISQAEETVYCVVESGGRYSSHKGVNLPNVDLSIPSLTSKDRKDLAFILGQDIHFVALSFVRSRRDLEALQRIIRRKRQDLRVIAKIEKPEAAQRIDDILKACDGIMVARGDLGVETSLFEVPILQKNLISRANASGKIVIVATQMLESMIGRPFPTRAESSDIANAILDGTDAIMLSGETAVGAYAVDAVETMSRIAEATERSGYYSREVVDLTDEKCYPPHAISEAAAWASRDLGGIPVLVFTISGDTALYTAKIRIQSAVYAFTISSRVACMLAMAWNAIPFVIPFNNDMAAMIESAEQVLIRRKLVRKGELIAVVCGSTPSRGETSSLRIKKVGEI